jgi:hypothetical protein
MIIHKDLAAGRWFQLSLVEQLGNVGSDVDRAIQWRNRDEKEYSSDALDRALELLDFTIADPKNRKRLREICRVREALVDYFLFDNEYKTNDKWWHNYFMYFAYIAAAQKGK